MHMRRQGKYTRRITPAQHVKRRVNNRTRWFRRLSWKRRLLVIGVPILTFLIVLPLATYLYFARDIANQDRLMNRNNTGIVLYATDGKTQIYSTGRAQHRELYPLDKISKPMKEALIASEDKDFYKHSGFSLFSTLRAVYGYVVNGGGSFGGSTITQQLAKNLFFSDAGRTYDRKLREAYVAWDLERRYNKERILNMYLNQVYFGNNAYGIERAASRYFDKTAAGLTIAESAFLAGLVKAPSELGTV
ncbi:MAG: hypothetical protein QG549_955, partial [Patescibacteria group bacterium]|nr:hypothetical protein [Patescibacteria group bacterium]